MTTQPTITIHLMLILNTRPSNGSGPIVEYVQLMTTQPTITIHLMLILNTHPSNGSGPIVTFNS
jgi:hypothetical protein